MGILNKKTIARKITVAIATIVILASGATPLVLLSQTVVAYNDNTSGGGQTNNDSNYPTADPYDRTTEDWLGGDWTFYGPNDEIIVGENNGKTLYFGPGYATGEKESNFYPITRYEQKPNYYKQDLGEATSNKSCFGHVDESAKITNLYIPRPDCDTAKDDWETYELDIQPMNSRIESFASAQNWGKRPVGCPGFDGAILDDANYNCPDGGAVIDGKYDEDANIEVQSGDDTKADSCDTSPGIMNWIVCPFGEMLAGATQLIDSMLTDMLFIDTDNWEQSGVKTIWEAFARIATTLIVLVLLVAIASQIFNFEVFSAYTIKKIMPKLFIAVILIWMSWFLAIAAINISNVVGFSVQSLISTPVEELAINNGVAVKNGHISFAEVTNAFKKGRGGDVDAEAGTFAALGVGAGIIGGTVGTIAILNGGWFFILLLLLTALLAVLMGFVAILLRYVILLGLIIALPLALVAWILPSTNKWFTQWKEMFVGLLLMFPIIMAVLTLGKMGAVIMAASAGKASYSFGANLALLSGAIILYFIPYFFIFKLLKLSGGALGKLQGALDGAGKAIREKGPMKALGEKVKADTDATREFKKGEAYKELAAYDKDDTNMRKRFKRRMNQATTSTLPMLAIGKSARGAQKRRNLQAEQKGLQENLEEENMANKTRDMQADEAIAHWRDDGSGEREVFVQVAGEGRIAKRDSTGAIARNRDGSAIMENASRAQRRAALKQLISTNDTQGFQDALDKFRATNVDERDPDATTEFNRALSSNELASSFGKKRPDWIQGSNNETPMAGDAAFKKFGGPQFAAFHKSGARELDKYLGELKRTNPDTYRETLSAYGSSMTSMVDNPESRATADANRDGMKVLKRVLGARLTEEVNSGRPIDDGMLGGIEVLDDRIDGTGSIH